MTGFGKAPAAPPRNAPAGGRRWLRALLGEGVRSLSALPRHAVEATEIWKINSERTKYEGTVALIASTSFSWAQLGLPPAVARLPIMIQIDSSAQQ